MVRPEPSRVTARSVVSDWPSTTSVAPVAVIAVKASAPATSASLNASRFAPVPPTRSTVRSSPVVKLFSRTRTVPAAVMPGKPTRARLPVASSA